MPAAFSMPSASDASYSAPTEKRTTEPPAKSWPGFSPTPTSCITSATATTAHEAIRQTLNRFASGRPARRGRAKYLRSSKPRFSACFNRKRASVSESTNAVSTPDSSACAKLLTAPSPSHSMSPAAIEAAMPRSNSAGIAALSPNFSAFWAGRPASSSSRKLSSSTRCIATAAAKPSAIPATLESESTTSGSSHNSANAASA